MEFFRLQSENYRFLFLAIQCRDAQKGNVSSCLGTATVPFSTIRCETKSQWRYYKNPDTEY